MVQSLALLAWFGGVPQCQPKCLQVGRALPGLFHVADCGIKLPAERPVKVADCYCRRATNTLSAVEIHRAACRDQAGQGADALGELLPKLNLFFFYGEPHEVNTRGLVVGFERLPAEIDGAHVLVRLQIQHRSDSRLPPESLDIGDSSGMRSDEESGKDLGVVHAARRSRFYQVIQMTFAAILGTVVSNHGTMI
jgi:hypothetical protein